MADTTLKSPKPAYTKKQAIERLWNMGRIAELKLHDSQLSVYQQFTESKDKIFLLNCSRRWGKSTLLCVLALEQALRFPGSQIRYAAPSAKAVRKIIMPLLRKLLEDCPKNIKPKLRTQDNTLAFPNESEIHISGTDKGNSENLRGTGMDLGLVDEAGFVDELRYVVSDILLPQTLTTRGRIMLASTPSTTPDHAFVKYAEECQAKGNYAHRTIYDNPLLTERDIIECIDEAKGRESVTFRREFLAEFIVDTERAVIPEFDAETEAAIVCDVERPPYFDAYVAMDVGFVNSTAVLFGYWDYKNAYLVIEDELVLSRMTTEQLAIGIAAKEKRLWGDKRPYLRVSDTNLIVIHDLSSIHKLVFSPTNKDDKEAAINALRMLIAERKIRISPSCKHLIAHLRHAVWNKQRNKFDKSDEGEGHFDTVDALSYLVRSLNRNHNPYPVEVDPRRAYLGLPSPRRNNDVSDVWANIFNAKRFL